jgi:hypothetical protein
LRRAQIATPPAPTRLRLALRPSPPLQGQQRRWEHGMPLRGSETRLALWRLRALPSSIKPAEIWPLAPLQRQQRQQVSVTPPALSQTRGRRSATLPA